MGSVWFTQLYIQYIKELKTAFTIYACNISAWPSTIPLHVSVLVNFGVPETQHLSCGKESNVHGSNKPLMTAVPLLFFLSFYIKWKKRSQKFTVLYLIFSCCSSQFLQKWQQEVWPYWLSLFNLLLSHNGCTTYLLSRNGCCQKTRLPS